MNTCEKIKLLDELQEYFLLVEHEHEKMRDDLCEESIVSSVFSKYADALTTAASELIGDDAAWLQWHIHENKWGALESTVELLDRDNNPVVLAVKSNADLIRIIDICGG